MGIFCVFLIFFFFNFIFFIRHSIWSSRLASKNITIVHMVKKLLAHTQSRGGKLKNQNFADVSTF